MIFISMPYGHKDPEVVKERMDKFYEVDAHLIERGEFPISPLNKLTTVENIINDATPDLLIKVYYL